MELPDEIAQEVREKVESGLYGSPREGPGRAMRAFDLSELRE